MQGEYGDFFPHANCNQVRSPVNMRLKKGRRSKEIDNALRALEQNPPHRKCSVSVDDHHHHHLLGRQGKVNKLDVLPCSFTSTRISMTCVFRNVATLYVEG